MKITNEKRYKIARAEIQKFERALVAAQQAEPPEGVDPVLHHTMQDALRAQLDELREDIRRYLDLKEGRVRSRVFHSLQELPEALIEARIAARLTQKELADRLGLHEQQIQRYEQTAYAGVTLARLQQIADALGLEVEEQVRYAAPA